MLITFEGVDGSGKSTQARRLVERLRAAGHRVRMVREPGGTEVSERIRGLLLDPALDPTPFAELLLFSAARRQLVDEVIRPALAAGEIVVCDRFFDSTTAYQGGARQVADADWIDRFNRDVTGGLVPDRTYLVAVPTGLALARRTGRAADRMEQGGAPFMARVAEAYATLAAREPARIVQIDGTGTETETHARIWADLVARFDVGAAAPALAPPRSD